MVHPVLYYILGPHRAKATVCVLEWAVAKIEQNAGGVNENEIVQVKRHAKQIRIMSIIIIFIIYTALCGIFRPKCDDSLL